VNHADALGALAIGLRKSKGAFDVMAGFRLASLRNNPILAAIHQTAPLRTPDWFRTRVKIENPKRSYGEVLPPGLYYDQGMHGNPAAVTFALIFTARLDGSDYRRALAEFARLWPRMLKCMKKPRFTQVFPGQKINPEASQRGHALFERECSKCHGHFGQDPT